MFSQRSCRKFMYSEMCGCVDISQTFRSIVFPSCLRSSSCRIMDYVTLTTKAQLPFETSGTTCPANLRHIREDLNLLEHRCENLKMSHEVFLLKYRVCFLQHISLTHVRGVAIK